MAKRLLKKCFLWICILSITFVSVSANAYADGQAKGKITLTGMLSNVIFSMYDVDVKMQGLNSTELRNLANTLEMRVMLAGQKPFSTKTSDKNGMVKWSNVPDGTYLITGKAVVKGEKLYTPAPVLVEIDDDEATIEVKYVKKYIGKKIAINVVKVWDDKGNQDKRPEEVEMWLLRNYTVYKKIKLNRDNNWIYTWKGLDSGSVWKVIEGKVPAGYTMSVEEDDYEFVITNTYEGEDAPEDKPIIPEDKPTIPDDGDTPDGDDTTTPDGDNGDTPDGDDTTTPDGDDTTTPGDGNTSGEDDTTTPDEEDTSNNNGNINEDGNIADSENTADSEKTDIADKDEGEKLPQSGQVWWPVPVLMAAGILFFLIGWRRRNAN